MEELIGWMIGVISLGFIVSFTIVSFVAIVLGTKKVISSMIHALKLKKIVVKRATNIAITWVYITEFNEGIKFEEDEGEDYEDDIDDCISYKVGFYNPDGAWQEEGEYYTDTEAAARVNYLNGGNKSINAE